MTTAMMGRKSDLYGVAVLMAVALCTTSPANASPIIFAASAPNAAGIQSTVDLFRAGLGTLNPNVAGSFGSGRREINWDGVPDPFAAPNLLPGNFFNVNSPRGVVFDTPGTGFEVSANAGVAPIQFDNINPSYSSQFNTFSAQRLFTSLGSNVIDVRFFVPGSTTPALTRGFGSVFTDVDTANATSIVYFDALNNSLGTFFVPSFTGDETLSFLGVIFDTSIVSRVRITNGNQALGPNTTGDVVVPDDFIYGEPSVVPEPASLLLLGTGLAAVAARRRLKLRTYAVHFNGPTMAVRDGRTLARGEAPLRRQKK